MPCDNQRPDNVLVLAKHYTDQQIDALRDQLQAEINMIMIQGYDDSMLVAEIEALKQQKADLAVLDKAFYTKTQADSRFITHKELSGYAKSSAHYTKSESDAKYIDAAEILEYLKIDEYEKHKIQLESYLRAHFCNLDKRIDKVDEELDELNIGTQIIKQELTNLTDRVGNTENETAQLRTSLNDVVATVEELIENIEHPDPMESEELQKALSDLSNQINDAIDAGNEALHTHAVTTKTQFAEIDKQIDHINNRVNSLDDKADEFAAAHQTINSELAEINAAFTQFKIAANNTLSQLQSADQQLTEELTAAINDINSKLADLLNVALESSIATLAESQAYTDNALSEAKSHADNNFTLGNLYTDQKFEAAVALATDVAKEAKDSSMAYSDKLFDNVKTYATESDVVVLAEAQRYADNKFNDARQHDDQIMSQSQSYTDMQFSNAIASDVVILAEAQKYVDVLIENIYSYIDQNNLNITMQLNSAITVLTEHSNELNDLKQRISALEALKLSLYHTDADNPAEAIIFEDNLIKIIVDAYTKLETLAIIDEKIAEARIPSFSYKVLATRPSVLSDEITEEFVIYFIPSETIISSSTIYDEYVLIDNKIELIGNTQIDLSNYITIEYLNSTDFKQLINDIVADKFATIDQSLENFDKELAKTDSNIEALQQADIALSESIEQVTENLDIALADIQSKLTDELANMMSLLNSFNTIIGADGNRYKYNFEILDGKPVLRYSQVE